MRVWARRRLHPQRPGPSGQQLDGLTYTHNLPNEINPEKKEDMAKGLHMSPDRPDALVSDLRLSPPTPRVRGRPPPTERPRRILSTTLLLRREDVRMSIPGGGNAPQMVPPTEVCTYHRRPLVRLLSSIATGHEAAGEVNYKDHASGPRRSRLNRPRRASKHCWGLKMPTVPVAPVNSPPAPPDIGEKMLLTLRRL